MHRLKMVLILLFPTILTGCGLFIAPPNEIEEITLTAVIDGYVNDAGLRNFGDPELWVDGEAAAPRFYILLVFDTDRIPPAARILSARLGLNCTAPPSGMNDQLRVLRVKEPWDPLDVTYPLDYADGELGMDVQDGKPGWYTAEIRAYAQYWANGGADFGVVLANTVDQTVVFEAGEAGGRPPELWIRYY